MRYLSLLIGAILLAALCWSSQVAALSSDEITIERPVTDHAQVLSAATVNRLETQLAEHQQETGVQIAVLTVATTGGVPIEDFSIAVADEWGGGSAAYDDGMLFTLAVEDRRNRIEVGYGLEGLVPDAVAATILESAVSDLQAEDYDRATEGVVDQLIAQTRGGVAGAFRRLHGGLTTATLLALLFFLVAMGVPMGTYSREWYEKTEDKKRRAALIALFALVIPIASGVSLLSLVHPSSLLAWGVAWSTSILIGWTVSERLISMAAVLWFLSLPMIFMSGLWIRLGLQSEVTATGGALLFVSLFYIGATSGALSDASSYSSTRRRSSSAGSSRRSSSSSRSSRGGGGSFGGGGASGSW